MYILLLHYPALVSVKLLL